MNKEELLEHFNKHVAYFKKNIAHEDVHAFAVQTYITALYFMHRWSQWDDLKEECKKSDIANDYIMNMATLSHYIDNGIDTKINVSVKEFPSCE